MSPLKKFGFNELNTIAEGNNLRVPSVEKGQHGDQHGKKQHRRPGFSPDVINGLVASRSHDQGIDLVGGEQEGV